jgi:ribosome recycling factor
MSEDDLFKYQDEAQNETDNYIKMIDEALVQKDKEVMEV